MKSALLPAATIPELKCAVLAASLRRRDNRFHRRHAHRHHAFQIQLVEIADQEPALTGVGSCDDPHSRRSKPHHAARLHLEILARSFDGVWRHALQRIAPVFFNLLGRIGIPQ